MSDDDVNDCDDVEGDFIGDFTYGADSVDDDDSPTLKYWTPRCPDDMKPTHLMTFKTLKDAEDYYRAYAKKVGFDVRISTHRTFARSDIIKEQYYVCNREGNHRPRSINWGRTNKSSRIGCGAKFMVKAATPDSQYTCLNFEERHTHDMMQMGGRHLMKSNRQLNVGHQKFMLICARANMGPIKSYNFFKEMVGGHCFVGAMKNDFKNFKRDMMNVISSADAQMVINRLKRKQDMCPHSCFAYDVDEHGQLSRLFWCDEVARTNFAAFGDVVSFDSTYRTNK